MVRAQLLEKFQRSRIRERNSFNILMVTYLITRLHICQGYMFDEISHMTMVSSTHRAWMIFLVQLNPCDLRFELIDHHILHIRIKSIIHTAMIYNSFIYDMISTIACFIILSSWLSFHLIWNDFELSIIDLFLLSELSTCFFSWSAKNNIK